MVLLGLRSFVGIPAVITIFPEYPAFATFSFTVANIVSVSSMLSTVIAETPHTTDIWLDTETESVSAMIGP